MLTERSVVSAFTYSISHDFVTVLQVGQGSNTLPVSRVQKQTQRERLDRWFPAAWAVRLWKEPSFWFLNLDLFVLHTKNGSYGFKPEWCILDKLQLVSRDTQGCPLSLSIICTLLFSFFPPHPLPISNMFLAPHHVILTKVLPPNESHGHAIVWWWSLLLFCFN